MTVADHRESLHTLKPRVVSSPPASAAGRADAAE
jgi:hypothetical protein